MTFSQKLERYVPLLVWIIAGLVILVIPLKIIALGYLPQDDALRHAARAVTGRPWSEIIVTGDVLTLRMEHNFGWHAFLRGLHLAANANAESLVILSVILLFAVLGCSGLVWMRRPEAWLVALLFGCVGAGLITRFALGRPFLLSMAALITVLMLWQKKGATSPGWRELTIMTSAIAVASFVHGCWYLWPLPVAAFFLAQQWRWALGLTASWLLGTVLGALPTGHPVDFLWQAVEVAIAGFGLHQTQRTMVSEFQPLSGDLFAVWLLAGLAILRALVKLKTPPLAKNPAFWLTCLCWALGFKAARFWVDWGWPALMVLIAMETQAWISAYLTENSLQRLVVTCGLAGTLLISTSSDVNSRWTYSLGTDFLTQDVPQLAGWLPEKGGVLYSSDMFVFYRTFFKNPEGQWRYILGYEPAFMPREDFAIYQRIKWNARDPRAYEPWVDKMKPADRLVVHDDSGVAATLRQLEWNCEIPGFCIGRLPRTNSLPPDPGLSSGKK